MERARQQILGELLAESDTLAERMLDRYLTTIPSYRSLPDETLRQVRLVNKRNVEGFVRAVGRGAGPGDEELAFVRESAWRRAREGVPLSALLQAYRLGAQLAWAQTLTQIGDDPARLRAGLDLATSVMKWVDEVSGAVAQAYLEEYERLTSDREAARRDFLDGALGGTLSAEEILARAEALGLDPTVPCSVVLIGPAETGEDSLVRTVQHRLKSMVGDLPHSGNSLTVARGEEFVVVFAGANIDDVALGGQVRAFVERAGAGTAGVVLRAGVGRARASLAELAASYREASIALAASRAGSNAPVAIYGQVLVEELILRERGVSGRLAQAILQPLAEHPDLRATLLEYIQHGPSLPAVARRLFLHPNTVSYRLARIRDLTGRDPKSPSGIAELVLALRAHQLVGQNRKDPA